MAASSNNTFLTFPCNEERSTTSKMEDNASEDEEGFEEEEVPPASKFVSFLSQIQSTFHRHYQTHQLKIRRILLIILVISFFVYFFIAMSPNVGRPPFPFPNPDNIFESNQGLALLTLTCLVISLIVWDRALPRYISKLNALFENFTRSRPRAVVIAKWSIVGVIVASLSIYLIVDIGTKNPENFASLLGLFSLLLFLFVFSKHPTRVKWTPVIGGTIIQLLLALFVLRTQFGFHLFEFLGNEIERFLSYTKAGSQFVFGNISNIAFVVFPTIVFFSAVVSVLFYLGLIQYVIRKLAWLMSYLLGTTAAESLIAAANIFLGQVEAILLIKPLLPDMTASELHAVMTSGFATIAGSLLAVYISFNVPANHLVTASVMSAPAALAASKLFYPETKKSRTTWQKVQEMANSPDRNIIEAISNGASQSISLVANVAVNLIAFTSALAFLNATTSWIFGNIRHPEIDFWKLMSWVFYPIAWLMGVTGRDCLAVGQLLSIKTFLSEFVAYEKLGQLISTRRSMNSTQLNSYQGNDVLFDDRSIVIATYALCGFSNLGSLGIQLGSMIAVVPSKKRTITKTIVRAMIAGNVACLMTACVAGLLFEKTPSQ